MCINSLYCGSNCVLKLPEDFDFRDILIITNCPKLNRNPWVIEKEDGIILQDRGTIRTRHYNGDEECKKCMLCQK